MTDPIKTKFEGDATGLKTAADEAAQATEKMSERQRRAAEKAAARAAAAAEKAAARAAAAAEKAAARAAAAAEKQAAAVAKASEKEVAATQRAAQRRADLMERAIAQATKAVERQKQAVERAASEEERAREKAHRAIMLQLKQQEQALASMDNVAGKFGDGFGKMLAGVGKALGVVALAAAAVGVAMKKAFDAGAEGSKIIAMTEFFDRSGKDINKYRDAVQGMISDAELMQKANLADSMGISQSTFMALAKVAQAASLKTGQSFDYMFDSIIVGTARSSRLLLDNLGIIVSVEEANKKYAKAALEAAGAVDQSEQAVNRYVKAMTDEESKIAFANEVKAKSIGMTKEMLDLNDKSAIGYAKVAAAAQNIEDEFKKTMTYMTVQWLPAIMEVFSTLQLFLEEWSKTGVLSTMWDGLVTSAKFAVRTVAGLFDGLVSSITKQLNRLPMVGLKPIITATGLVDQAFGGEDTKATTVPLTRSEQMSGALQQLIRGVKAEGFVSGTDNEVLKKIMNLSEEQLAEAKAGKDGFYEMVQAIQKLAVSTGRADKPAAPGSKSADKDKKGQTTEQKMAKINAQVEDRQKEVIASLGDLSMFDFTDQELKNYVEDILASYKLDLMAAAKVLDVLPGEVAKLRLAIEHPQDVFTKDAQAAKDKLQKELASDQVAQDKTDVKGQKADDAAAQKEENKLTSDIKGIGGQIAGFLSGGGLGGVGTAIGSAIGGPLGAVIGVIIEMLIPLITALKPVTDFLTLVATMLSVLVEQGLTPFLTALLGPMAALYPLFFALGNIVQAIMAPFTDLIGIIMDVLMPVFTVVASFLTMLAPIIKMLAYVGLIPLLIVLGPLIAILWLLTPVLEALSVAFDWLMQAAIKPFGYFVVDMINAVMLGIQSFLSFMGDLNPLADFKKLKKNFFEPQVIPTKENTDAVNKNTEAVRDLTREFRNLPSGYKVENMIYRSQTANMALQESLVVAEVPFRF